MLFSCSVDADRTCTEAFCNPELAAERTTHSARPSLAALQQELDASLNILAARAQRTAVNRQRAEVLAHCKAAQSLEPGSFRSTCRRVAARRCRRLPLRWGMHLRKICRGSSSRVRSLPLSSRQPMFTGRRWARLRRQLWWSITSLQPARDTRANQIGAETWDAPVIVTTNVQLLDSLFAFRTTPCRKLHHLARSVIVLDEAQTIPVEYLKPVLAALRELVLKRTDCRSGGSVRV